MASFVQEPDVRTLVAITDCVYALRQTEASAYSSLYSHTAMDAAPFLPPSVRRTVRSQAETAPHTRDRETNARPLRGGSSRNSKITIQTPNTAASLSTVATPVSSYSSLPNERYEDDTRSSSPRRLFPRQTPAAAAPVVSTSTSANVGRGEPSPLVDVEESSLRYQWPRDDIRRPAVTHADRDIYPHNGVSGECRWRSGPTPLTKRKGAPHHCAVGSEDEYKYDDGEPSLLRLRITPLAPSTTHEQHRCANHAVPLTPLAPQPAADSINGGRGKAAFATTTFTTANRQADRVGYKNVGAAGRADVSPHSTSSSLLHLAGVSSKTAALSRRGEQRLPATSSSGVKDTAASSRPLSSVGAWQRPMRAQSSAQHDEHRCSATAASASGRSTSPASPTVATEQKDGSVAWHGRGPSRVSMGSPATAMRSCLTSPSPAAPFASDAHTHLTAAARLGTSRSPTQRNTGRGSSASCGSVGSVRAPSSSSMRRCSGENHRCSGPHASTQPARSASQSAAGFVRETLRGASLQRSEGDTTSGIRRDDNMDAPLFSSAGEGKVNSDGPRQDGWSDSPLRDLYARYTFASAAAAASHVPRLASPPQRPHRALRLSPSPSSPVPLAASTTKDGVRYRQESSDRQTTTAMLRAAVQRMQQASNAAVDASAMTAPGPSSAEERYALLVESARLLSSSVLVFTALAPGDRQNPVSAVRSASAVCAAAATPPRPATTVPLSHREVDGEARLLFTVLRDPQADCADDASLRGSAPPSPLPGHFPVARDVFADRRGTQDSGRRAETSLPCSLLPSVSMDRMEGEGETRTEAAGPSSCVKVPTQPSSRQSQHHQPTMRRSMSTHTSAEKSVSDTTTATTTAPAVQHHQALDPQRTSTAPSSLASTPSSQASLRRRAVLAPEDILDTPDGNLRSSVLTSTGQRPTVHRNTPVEAATDFHLSHRAAASQPKCLPLETQQVQQPSAQAEPEHSKQSTERGTGSSATREVSITRPPPCSTRNFGDGETRDEEEMRGAVTTQQPLPHTAQRRYGNCVSPVKEATAALTGAATTAAVAPPPSPPASLSHPKQHHRDDGSSPHVFSASLSPLTPPPLEGLDYRSPRRDAPTAAEERGGSKGARPHGTLRAEQPHSSTLSPPHRAQALQDSLRAAGAGNAEGHLFAQQSSRNGACSSADGTLKSSERNGIPVVDKEAQSHPVNQRHHNRSNSGESLKLEQEDAAESAHPLARDDEKHDWQLLGSTASHPTSFSSRHREPFPSAGSTSSAFDWVADGFAAAIDPHCRDVSHSSGEDVAEGEEGVGERGRGLGLFSAPSITESRQSCSHYSSESPSQRQCASPSFSGESMANGDINVGAGLAALRRRLSRSTSSGGGGGLFPPPPPSPTALQQHSPLPCRPHSQAHRHTSGAADSSVHHANPSFSFAGSCTSIGAQSNLSVERTPTTPFIAHVAAMEPSRCASQIPGGAALFADSFASTARSTAAEPPDEEEHVRRSERGASRSAGGEHGREEEGGPTRGVLWVAEGGHHFAQPRLLETGEGEELLSNAHDYGGGDGGHGSSSTTGSLSDDDHSRASAKPPATSEWEVRREEGDKAAASTLRTSRQSTLLRGGAVDPGVRHVAAHWQGKHGKGDGNDGDERTTSCCYGEPAPLLKRGRSDDAAVGQKDCGGQAAAAVTAVFLSAQDHSSRTSGSSASTSPRRSTPTVSSRGHDVATLYDEESRRLATQQQRTRDAAEPDFDAHIDEHANDDDDMEGVPHCRSFHAISQRHDCTAEDAGAAQPSLALRDPAAASRARAPTAAKGTFLATSQDGEASTSLHSDPPPLLPAPTVAARTRLPVLGTLSKPPMVPSSARHPRLAGATGASVLLSPSLYSSNVSGERSHRIGGGNDGGESTFKQGKRHLHVEVEEADFFDEGYGEDEDDRYCSYGYGEEEMDV